jgi:predicted transcriptional regulator
MPENDGLSSNCKRYDLAEDQIKAFTRSGIRAKIMLCLKHGPKTAAEMERLLGTRATTILHAIKEMSDADIVERTASGYALTNIGYIQACILDDLVSCIAALKEHRDFWLTHDVSGIPVNLQKGIGKLAQSEIVVSDPGAILKTVEYFLAELNKSREIYGVSPIIIPGYSDTIASAVKRGVSVHLILTDDILKIVLAQHRELLKELLRLENFHLYCIGNGIKVAFTVTDNMLDFGLFRKDGGYDLGADLICIGESAITWGKELFDYYRSLSTRVEDIDLKKSK